jgi:hypothetical protein
MAGRVGLVFFALVLAAGGAEAQTGDCRSGRVMFDTSGKPGELTLTIHERRAEVPKGLFGLAELPSLGGVFSIYPEPRSSRTLANSDVLAADLMTFGADGRVIAMLQDQTGASVDRMSSGDGMLYAAYLAGGTIAEMGFGATTVMTGWTCTDGG